MKAEDFFEKQMANIRELWHLSDLQKKTVYILMEEYAALHIADVVGRSEQLKCEHKGRRTATELVEYCEDCKKILFHP